MPSSLASQWAHVFRQTQALYNNETDQESFIVAFSFLVSPNGPAQHAALLDRLVQLEQYYAASIKGKLENIDRSVRGLKRQQQDELAATPAEERDEHRARQQAELEASKTLMESSLRELCRVQQQEYQAVVIHLFQVLQSSPSDLDDPNTVAQLLENAVNRLKVPPGAVLKQFMTEDFALLSQRGNLSSESFDSSLQDAPRAPQSGESQSSSAIASKLKRSLSLLSIDSIAPSQPTPTRGASITPDNLYGKDEKRRGSVSSTASSSKAGKEKTVLGKFGSLLYKIIDNESSQKSSSKSVGSPSGLLEPLKSHAGDVVSPIHSIYEEPVMPSPIYANANSSTFSFYLGTQVRRLYNLQLVPCAVSQLAQLPRIPSQALAIRLATARELYRPHALKALLLVVRKRELEGTTPANSAYLGGRGSNKHLFKACKENHELHFDSIQDQLTAAIDFITGPKRAKQLQEGDLLVTRHSGLPAIHLILHLVVNDDSLVAPLSSQSPVLQGLRNAIKLLDVCTVSHLTLPLSLLPESIKSSSDVDEPKVFGRIADPVEYVAQRCQHVLKTLKAGFGESEGLAKHGTFFQNIALHGRWITALSDIPPWVILSSPSTMKKLSSSSLVQSQQKIKDLVTEYTAACSLKLEELIQEKMSDIFKVE